MKKTEAPVEELIAEFNKKVKSNLKGKMKHFLKEMKEDKSHETLRI